MGRRRKYAEELTGKILTLYARGYSLNEIARRTETHPEVVKRRLKENGINIRNLSDAMKQFHKKRKENEGEIDG